MQFAIAAILKTGVESELFKLSDQFNEHIGPSGTNIRIAGVLRDEAGGRVGYLAIFEGDSIGQAQEWAGESPIFQAHLYDRLDIFEYEIEVGRLI